jgi:hypothetical protein
MQSEVKTIISTRNGAKVITLFGYSSSGVPGLEILGLGVKGRILKEKLIYLSKIKRLKIPPKRYVISVDLLDLDNNIHSLKNMEFAILILFWHLAQIIPIGRLNDCICCGEVRVSGEVLVPLIPQTIINELRDSLRDIDDYKIISEENHCDLLQISPSMLLSEISNLSFKNINLFDTLDKSISA